MSGCLDFVGLTALMELTEGRNEVRVALIDGPVALNHPELAGDRLRMLHAEGSCDKYSSSACRHGTFIAGVMFAKRSSSTPGICPNCTLLVRPVFSEGHEMVRADHKELALAVKECVDAGARVINLSLALAQFSSSGLTELAEAIHFALRRGTLIVAAAGNQGTISTSVITRHPWVIPVAACDRRGGPTRHSNIGPSIGQRGLSAPGESIAGIGPEGQPATLGGTSAATPFVTGAIALLLSEFPQATAAQIKSAITPHKLGRAPLVPPLLNAWQGYQVLKGLR